MPATAVNLLDALQTAIGGHTWSAEFECARVWSTLSDRTSPETTVDISWESWRLLGAAGNLRLEQHHAGILLQAPVAGTTAAVCDPFAALREELVDFLTDWADDEAGFRVLHVQAPAPFDRSKLLTPGFWQSRLLLDCDALRAVGTDTPPEAPGVSPVLSAARSGVWNAIDNFPSLANVFARKYKTDVALAELLLRDPAPHELPAIALTWRPMPVDWWTHQQQQWQPTLSITLWLPATWHTAAEHLAQLVSLAVYQAKPEGSSLSYVKAATGNHPKRVGPINVEPVTIGRVGLTKAIRVDADFVLRSNLNPFEGS